MKRLRLWTVALGLWLIFIFNIERMLLIAERMRTLFDLDVNLIQSYTYVFVALMMIMVLLLPKIRGLWFSILTAIIVSLFLVLWYNLPMWSRVSTYNFNQVSSITLLAIIQVSAIILTGLLTRQVNRAIHEFEGVISNIAFNHIGARPVPFYEAQGGMYRELKRARYYQRPLAVIALEIDPTTMKAQIPEIMKDVQQAMMKEYVMAKAARILDDKLHEFNAIALHDNRFIVLLPETNSDHVNEIALRLESELLHKMKLRLQVGTASFPRQGITFETLIERAIENIGKSPDTSDSEIDASNLETEMPVISTKDIQSIGSTHE